MTVARVSVLLPAYNVGAFVAQAVLSVHQQTYEDWEIVAVDDHSTDRTHEVLQDLARQHRRIHLHRNDSNLGMTQNWNRALSLAEGELVLKLDGDDALQPRTLELLTSAFSQDSIVGAGVRTLACSPALDPFDGLEADDAMMRGGINPYEDHLLDNTRWYRIAAQGYQLWHSCAVMFRRSFLDAIGRFDVRFGCASDTELIWRALEQKGTFAHRAYPGVLYRTRPGSVSEVFRSKEWLTWEGTAANLLTLHRWRQRHALPRFLRFRYAELWQRWMKFDDDGDADRVLRPDIAAALRSVVAEVKPPSAADRLLFKARRALSRVSI